MDEDLGECFQNLFLEENIIVNGSGEIIIVNGE